MCKVPAWFVKDCRRTLRSVHCGERIAAVQERQETLSGSFIPMSPVEQKFIYGGNATIIAFLFITLTFFKDTKPLLYIQFFKEFDTRVHMYLTHVHWGRWRRDRPKELLEDIGRH